MASAPAQNGQTQIPPMQTQGGFSPMPVGMQPPPPMSVPMNMPPPMSPAGPMGDPQQAEGQRRQMAMERLRQMLMQAQQGGRGPMMGG